MSFDNLNEQQKQAVLHTEGPLLLLAGAGSGKTGVLTHRIAYMIDEKDINPYNILAITFTNKAANEMRERVDRLIGFGAQSVWVMTFHATCVRILRKNIERIGYAGNFTIYDTDDQKTLMKEVCKNLDIDTKVYREKTLLQLISNAKDELITPDEMELSAGTDYQKKKIAGIYREYQRLLKANNALDFDDIIVKTVELFKSDESVLEYYQDRFRYIMVDEYQDTNTAQFKFISLLAGKHRNICVVGDDDQSIYKFRGANIKNILNFEQHFPGARVIKLEQNYRSTGNILNAANSVIRNNMGRTDKSLWTEHPDGDKVNYSVYYNEYEEAEGIAIDVKRKVDSFRYDYNDCAVLYRTNAQSRNIEEKMISYNIPYRIYGGVNFYSRKEIKDVLAYLKTIDNAMDDLNVRRIINVPKRGIGNTTVEKVSAYAYEHEMGFFDALLNVSDIAGISKAAAGKITPFVELITGFRKKLDCLSIKELIEEIIEAVGYENYLLDSDTPEEVDERMENIAELISKAAAFEESVENPTLSLFLEEVALVADIDNMDDSNNVVSLMTLHSAKGLEFPVVYLCGMEDGLFPSYMSITSEDRNDLEEERRLCYVGITRAEKELYLSMARQRMVRGELQIEKPSRFIKEIPAEYLNECGQGVSKPGRFVSSTYSSPFADSVAVTKPNVTDSYRMAQPKSVSSENLGYEVGDMVRHIKFGEGKVLQIANGGRDYEVTVDFSKAGTKKMFASFAKLVKID